MTTALDTWAKTAAVAVGGMMESAAIEVGELAAIVQELESAADQLKEIEEARAKLRRQNLDPVESAEIGLGMRPEVPDNDLVLRDIAAQGGGLRTWNRAHPRGHCPHGRAFGGVQPRVTSVNEVENRGVARGAIVMRPWRWR